MGEAMALMAVFSECLPDQFLTSQGINLLDGTTRMPPEAFEGVKVSALNRLSLEAFAETGTFARVLAWSFCLNESTYQSC